MKNLKELEEMFQAVWSDANHRALAHVESVLSSLRLRGDLFNVHLDDMHLAVGRGRSLKKTAHGFAGRDKDWHTYHEFDCAEEAAYWLLEEGCD